MMRGYYSINIPTWRDAKPDSGLSGPALARYLLSPPLGYKAYSRHAKVELENATRCLRVYDAVMASLIADGLTYSVQVFRDADTPCVVVRASGKATRKRKPVKYKPALTPSLTPEQVKRHAGDAAKTLESAKTRIRDNMKRQLEPCGWWRHEWTERPAPSAEDWQAMYGTAPPDYRADYVKRRRAQRRFGKAVARVMAIHRSRDPYKMTKTDYAILDEAAGVKVKRESGVPRGKVSRARDSYLAWAVKNYADGSLSGTNRHTPEPPDEVAGDTPTPSPIQDYQHAKLDLEYWREMEVLSGQRDKWKPGLRAEDTCEDEGA